MKDRINFKIKKKAYHSFSALALAGCNSDIPAQDILENEDSVNMIGASSMLSGIEAFSATTPIQKEVNELSNIFQKDVADPYWVKSLEMEEYDLIRQYFEAEPNVIYYAFPQTMPNYFDKIADKNEWQPVNLLVELSTIEILEATENILNINFEPTTQIKQPFVVSVMSNEQGSSDAYSYFPSTQFSIGSDIFIDDDLLSPKQLSYSKTNYEYELIVHELGHALGLKHPFAPLGNNEYVLPNIEDTSRLTAMTYSEDSNFFNGQFRSFDYLTLVQIYGINPSYNSMDNSYSFSATGGTYIIDGGGQDLIDTSMYSEDALIDLRENSHSYLGVEHQYISAAFQMTISANSEIEDVITGAGNDYILGNSLANRIATGSGNDVIFAGEGRDIIEAGSGSNQLNLFENTSSNDFIVFDSNFSSQFNQVYNFEVSGVCDVLVFDSYLQATPKLSPVSYFSSNSTLNQYDICFFEDFYANNNINDLKISASTDKVILLGSDNPSDFDIELYFYDESINGTGSLFHLASIMTNDSNLSDWSAENFYFI